MSLLVSKLLALIKLHIGGVFLSALVLVFGTTLYFGVRSYEGKLASADAAYKQLQATDAAHEATLKLHTEARAVQTAQVLLTDKNMKDRDKTSQLLQAEVVVANASVDTVQTNSDKFLNAHGISAPDGSFVFKKVAVQSFIATKIDDTAAKADVVDLTTKAATLTDMVGTTQADLTTCESDKAATAKVLVDYKRAAKSSKWKRALDVTEKVGLFVAGGAIVYELKR